MEGNNSVIIPLRLNFFAVYCIRRAPAMLSLFISPGVYKYY